MSCFKGISSMNKCEVLALTDAISVALSDGLITEDLNVLGNLLMTIGSVITTFAALPAATQNSKDPKPNSEIE